MARTSIWIRFLVLHSLLWISSVLGDFCDRGAAIPSAFIQCGTCAGQCETKTVLPTPIARTVSPSFNSSAFANLEGNFDQSPLFSPTASRYQECFCDGLCILYGDCCKDFQEECPVDFAKAQDLIRDFSHYGHTQFTCKSGVMMKSTCVDGVTTCRFDPQLSSDVNMFVPMYDLDKNIHYISGHCALCNNAFNVIPWGVNLTCESKDLTPLIRSDEINTKVINITTDRKQSANSNRGNFINSTAHFEHVRNSSRCHINYQNPNLGKTRKCKGSMKSNCRSGCLNEDLVKRCETEPPQYVYYSDYLYKNPFCALCRNPGMNLTKDLRCLPNCLPPFCVHSTGMVYLHVYIQTNGYIEKFSMTMIFDFDPGNGLVIGVHDRPECAEGEIYHPEEGACRTIACQKGFILKGTACVPELSKIIVSLNITLKERPTDGSLNETSTRKRGFEQDILFNVAALLKMYGIEQQLQVTSFFQFYDESFNVKIVLHCNCDYSIFNSNGDIGDTFMKNNLEFRQEIRKFVTDLVLDYVIKMGMEAAGFSSKLSFEMNNTTMTDASNCLWLLYSLHEVDIKNDSVVISNTEKLYSLGSFELLNDSVLVCETDLGKDEDGSAIQFALGIVTLICVCISIVCLLIRIVLQLCVRKFNSRPGKLQFNLSIAVLVAFLFLLTGPFVVNENIWCRVAAAFLCYGIFSSFCWMNVIAVDTWLAFRPSQAFRQSIHGTKSLIIPIIIGWGVPLILVAIPLGLDFSEIVENYKPNFGGKRCWFTHRIALLTYFALPVGISIIINIFFYICTSINLHKAFTNARLRSTKKTYSFVVYVRLFVLMGATWIFGFLSAFLDERSVDFIFVILTSLQGVFMFISFVCNKEVFSELRGTFKSKKHAPDSKKIPKTKTEIGTHKHTKSNETKMKKESLKLDDNDTQKEKKHKNVLMPLGDSKSRSLARKVIISQIREKFTRSSRNDRQTSMDNSHYKDRKKRESIA